MLMAEKKSLHEKFKGFEEELQKRDDKITNLETMLKKNCANHNQD
jgi:Skp family chaperone for outer membrane proteins